MILAVIYLTGLALYASPSATQHWGPMVRAASSGGWPRHLWTLLALVIAPPVEEFMFRGVMFAGLSRSWSATTAGTVVTVLFLAIHLTEIWGFAPAVVSITALGIAALLARVLTGSLAPAIALHTAYNLVIVVATYARH